MNKSGNAREKATVIANFDGELYFAIPATSASSECDFSVARNTFTQRCRLATGS